jgi:hypothetical protein
MAVKRVAISITAFALAAGALPAPAHGASVGEFVSESLVAGLAELGALSLAAGLAAASSGWETGTDNPGGLALAGILAASYPLAAACGAYCMGESHSPSENKGPALGTTVLAAYGQLLVVAGVAGTVYKATDINSGDVIVTAAATDIFTKPIFVTYVYNAKKKPASPADSRLAVEPYLCAATASDGGAVPMYGVTVSF